MGTICCDRGQERAARSILEPNSVGTTLLTSTLASYAHLAQSGVPYLTPPLGRMAEIATGWASVRHRQTSSLTETVTKSTTGADV